MNTYLSVLSQAVFAAAAAIFSAEITGQTQNVGGCIAAVAICLYSMLVAKHANNGIRARFGSLGVTAFTIMIWYGLICICIVATQMSAPLQRRVSLPWGVLEAPAKGATGSWASGGYSQVVGSPEKVAKLDPEHDIDELARFIRAMKEELSVALASVRNEASTIVPDHQSEVG